MRESQAVALLAAEVMEAELDDMLDRLLAIGEEEPPPPRARVPVADEYRLLVNYGGEGTVQIRTQDLGVVNEAFALRKAQEMRRDYPGVGIERRKLLRGSWQPVSPVGGGDGPEEPEGDYPPL